MKKICFVTTVDVTIKAFLLNHLKELSKYYKITVVTNTSNEDFLKDVGISNIDVINLKINRKISLLKDLKSLINLVIILKKNDFSCIHSITPKAGLLAAIAAKVSNVDRRIHIFTGQVWKNYKGIKRIIFKIIDKTIVFFNTDILVDSLSQKKFLIEERILKKNQGIVLGAGSISGVDLRRFKKNKKLRNELRKKNKIASGEVVFGFIGRLNEDKGIKELLKVFDCKGLEEVKLLIIGSDEENLEKELKKNNIIYLGFKPNPEKYLNIIDVFCLPSHREGFGSVLIEAGAMGIPSIASDIYGIQDAVHDNETGLLHKLKDIEGMRKKMMILKEDDELRKKLGDAAEKRVIEEFSAERVTKEWVNFYKECLNSEKF